MKSYIPLEYKKRLLLRCKHQFKSDLINNMDHMRISSTEPSSVILSQSNSKNWKVMPQKCRIKLKPNGMVKPQPYFFLANLFLKQGINSEYTRSIPRFYYWTLNYHIWYVLLVFTITANQRIIFIRLNCRDVLWYGAGVCLSVCPQSL